MGNIYCGRTNNRNPKPARASHLKAPEPERFVSLDRLVERMVAAFGTIDGEATRHAVLRRMGIEPVR